MRIGKNRPGSSPDQGIHGRRVGVFLYCQQHAREWATPLTCLETAEQLLRNYGIDKTTRKLVDELDIFILPASNPDGAHYSMHNFNSQRKTMTNWCMNGGLETDDPNAASFWTPRPSSLPGGVTQPFNDSAARNAWGTDMNRNNTFGDAHRRLHRRVDVVRQRGVRRARPRPPSRRSRTSSGSRTRSRTSGSRTTSTASAATSCGRRAPTYPTAARATPSTRTSASRSTSSRPATGS